jgi:glycerol-3-phosphate dehydrogenase (NAD(P)+)
MSHSNHIHHPVYPDRPTVAVLGVGQMGLVCASLLSQPDPSGDAGRPVNVVMWGHSPDEVGQLAQTRSSSRLPGFELPPTVHVVLKERDAVKNASIVVSAIPVQFIRDVWTRIRPHLAPDAGVVSVAKGLEISTLLRPTQIIADVLKDDPDARPRPLGCLSGPTIAAELARCLPAAMIAASDDVEFARRVQLLFNTSWLRVYTNPDVLGVELAGAIKNVIAIAAGAVDGLNAGNNAKSSLLARGLAEIARLGSAMGAHPDTFFGIAGVGDLATTCFSPEGRNRSCGEAIGRGIAVDEYLRSTPFVVEGVSTVKAVLELAKKYRVEMPITQAVHAVLFESMDPIEAIGKLMSREPKPEKVV